MLKVVDELPLKEQEASVEIMQRHVIERRREEFAKEIQDTQREFQAGRCHPVTPDELMAEILS